MSKKRVRYSTEFKLDAVRRMADCESVSGLAKELEFGGQTTILSASPRGQESLTITE